MGEAEDPSGSVPVEISLRSLAISFALFIHIEWPQAGIPCMCSPDTRRTVALPGPELGSSVLVK